MKILIIESRFYDDIADELLAGAQEELKAQDAECDVVTVPGAFETPAALSYAISSQKEYDGYVTLGCVIRGKTFHFEIVAQESARALVDLSVRHKLCLGNAILTVENKRQAMNRALRSKKNLGAAAARACMNMIRIKEELK